MSRYQKSKDKIMVTRIAKVGNLSLNVCKSNELDLIAFRLGVLRKDIWQEFGSLKAWGISEYEIDKFLRPNNKKYQLPAKLWEATLYDVIGDIHLAQASCIEKVLAKMEISYQKAKARKSPVQMALEGRDWLTDSYLSRLVRENWHRGHTNVNNQIVIKQYDCLTDKNGVVWLKFGGLTKGKPLKIPTTLPSEIKGQIRLIKRNNKWYIHYNSEISVLPKKKIGKEIGIDRGYSEVYVTSSNDGNRFLGSDFGKTQTQESDYRKEKGVRRNKLRAIAEKAKKKGNHQKANRIKENNLGRKKWNKREQNFKGKVKTLVFTATKELMRDDIKTVAYEDLTQRFTSKQKRSRRTKRNLNTWCKGVVREALTQVSARVGCTVVEVNACYTSQLDSRFGVLLGTRKGDKFIGFDGGVLQADINAADNVLARMSDAEITLFTKHTVAKEILLKRTQKFQEQSLKQKEVILEAKTDKDESQSRERVHVNPTANPQQLTLFNLG